jgi:hypothetical protein
MSQGTFRRLRGWDRDRKFREEATMPLILWLLGVPLSVVIVLWLIGVI